MHQIRRRRAIRTVLVAALAAALWLPATAGTAGIAGAATPPPLTVVFLGGLGSTPSDYGQIQSFLTGKGYVVKVFSAAHGGWQWDTATNDYKRNASGGQIQERIEVMTTEFKGWLATNVSSPSISLVAHSAGGLIARNYVKKYDPANRVKKLIMSGVANYGTQFNSVGSDYAVGSTFLAGLNAGDVSKAGVGYWSFTTAVDNIVFPYENQQLPRTAGTTSTSLSYPYVTHPIPGVLPDPQVTNLIIQEQCPWALIPHVGMTGTVPVQSAIAQALEGKRTITVTC